MEASRAPSPCTHPTAVGPTRSEHFDPLSRLLLETYRAVGSAAGEALRFAGGPDVTPAAWRLLVRLGPDGARAASLARELGMSRQASGQLVAELERAGYVERRQDPRDGRARRVRLTSSGKELVREGRTALEALESRWADRLGRARFRALRRTLRELGELASGG